MYPFRLTCRHLRPIVCAQIAALPPTSTQTTTQATLALHSSISIGSVRHYAAKGKDKLKTKARDLGVKFAKVHFTDDQLRELINLDQLHGQLEKAVDTMRNEFIQNLSLRSTTGSIETLPVPVDGAEHELQELAQIVRKNPKTIVVNLAAFPQCIPAVLQALQKSGMNLNPQQDGTTVFIPVPKITKEHREQLAKNAKQLHVKCRDAIKDAQNGVIRKLKRDKEIASDDNHSAQLQVLQIGDKYLAQADQMLVVKQAELVGDKL